MIEIYKDYQVRINLNTIYKRIIILIKLIKMKTETKEKNQVHTPHNHKLLTGVTSDKYAILLDDGKTIVFISDKSKEAETRLKYKKLGLFKRV